MRALIDWLRRLRPRHKSPATSDLGKPAAHSTHVGAEALLAEARVHVSRSELEAAWKNIATALELDPESAAANSLAARVSLARNDLESALDYFTLALHFDPDDWSAANGRSEVLQRSGELTRAIGAIGSFLNEHPGHPACQYRLATLHYAAGAHEEALRWLRERLTADPDDVASLNMRGLILAREYGQLEQGNSVLKRALHLKPDYDDARSNLGMVYSDQGRIAEALACFDAVLARNPGDQETRLMRSYLHLRNGEFSLGWQDYWARHASPMADARIGSWEERCTVRDIYGKRVLIIAEQGLGDQIMFASCMGDLLARVASCVLECDSRLVGLFQRSFPTATVIGRAPEGVKTSIGESDFDFKIAMGSLPKLFRNSWADFPDHAGYLQADPARVKFWRDHLASLGPGTTIGISWRGGAVSTRQRLRSVPLRLWRDLLKADAHIVSLQYGECDQEVREFEQDFGRSIIQWPEVIWDYDETAALVSSLDMVISVCTAVVHLGGALGRPVWVLTPKTPEWRYLASGTAMPWYPSVRLFRQAQNDPWEAVIQRIAAERELGRGNGSSSPI